MIRTRLHCDLPGALLNFTNLETFEDWKKSPSFLEAALYIRPHSLIGRSKKLKNFIEAAAYQRSFTVLFFAEAITLNMRSSSIISDKKGQCQYRFS